jgi:hypothetical protein
MQPQLQRVAMAGSNPINNMVSGLQSAYGLLKDIADLEQAHAIKAQIADLMRQLLSARENAMSVQMRETALLQEIGALKEQINQMETWDTEKQRYRLHAVDSGAFAYVLKPDMQSDEPPHWLCTQCFEKRHKSILQFKEQLHSPSGMRSDRSKWMCPNCRAELNVSYTTKPNRA